jgi:hypothetical protein
MITRLEGVRDTQITGAALEVELGYSGAAFF